MNRRIAAVVTTAALPLMMSAPVLAHAGHEHTVHAAAAGLMHPMLGLDHLLAMVAVGLLAVRAQTRAAMWAMPAAFVAMMLVGGILALTGMPLPGGEIGISVSVIAIGVAIAAMKRVHVASVSMVLGVFALAHGYAHGTEIVGDSTPLFLTGMALGTTLLHAVGIGTGLVIHRVAGAPWLRAAGGTITTCFGLILALGM